MSSPTTKAFDVCIVGHLTDDTLIGADNARIRQPGGVPTYAPHLLAASGLRTAVVTRGTSEALRRARLDAGGAVAYFYDAGDTTTKFINTYSATAEERVQHVPCRAVSIGPEMIGGINAGVWLFGPLLGDDIAPKTYRAAAERGVIALDIQGLCRVLEGTLVTASAWPHVLEVLRCTEIVKASRQEARTVTGCETPEAAIADLLALGVAEVLITDAGTGLWLGTAAGTRHIPAPTPVRVVDTTGCGDTLLAAYLLLRLRRVSPEAAALAGAHAAAVKAGMHGPLRRLPVELKAAAAARAAPGG